MSYNQFIPAYFPNDRILISEPVNHYATSLRKGSIPKAYSFVNLIKNSLIWRHCKRETEKFYLKNEYVDVTALMKLNEEIHVICIVVKLINDSL